jgi:membrane-associated phospholipid phosphatase
MLSIDTWIFITHLGNSVLLLSTALLIALWLLRARASEMSFSWLVILGIAALLVLFTKLAFLGWGLGIESIDFTGISGHAMLSSAVFPVLAAMLTLKTSPVLTKASIGAGFLVAVVVGISRLVLNSHSPSEVILGWVVGCSVALPTLYLLHRMTEGSRARLSPWPIVMGFTALLAITAPRDGRPGPETHPLIVKMALWASGRSEPFHRNSLHERISEAPESQRAIPTIATY